MTKMLHEETITPPDDDLYYFEAIRGNLGGITPQLKRKAYIRLITYSENLPRKIMEREELCMKALLEFPGDIDFMYLLGETQNLKGKYTEAWKTLMSCEKLLDDVNESEFFVLNIVRPGLLYEQLAETASKLGDKENKKKYTQMAKDS